MSLRTKTIHDITWLEEGFTGGTLDCMDWTHQGGLPGGGGNERNNPWWLNQPTLSRHLALRPPPLPDATTAATTTK